MHRGLALACAALLVLASARSASAAGEGDAWVGTDKALHFGVSATIAGTSYGLSTLFVDARAHSLLLAAGATTVVGAGKEALDAAGLGTPSWKDLAWDGVGMIVGLGVAYAIDLLVRGVSERRPLFVQPTSP